MSTADEIRQLIERYERLEAEKAKSVYIGQWVTDGSVNCGGAQ